MVRPFAVRTQQTALAINPYHLGFSMWEHIVEKQGLDAARAHLREEDDFGFVRNYLDRELAEKLGPVRLRGDAGTARSRSRPATSTRCARRSSRRKFNYGAPRIAASRDATPTAA